jgi:hypothetical protein
MNYCATEHELENLDALANRTAVLRRAGLGDLGGKPKPAPTENERIYRILDKGKDSDLFDASLNYIGPAFVDTDVLNTNLVNRRLQRYTAVYNARRNKVLYQIKNARIETLFNLVTGAYVGPAFDPAADGYAAVKTALDKRRLDLGKKYPAAAAAYAAANPAPTSTTSTPSQVTPEDMAANNAAAQDVINVPTGTPIQTTVTIDARGVWNGPIDFVPESIKNMPQYKAEIAQKTPAQIEYKNLAIGVQNKIIDYPAAYESLRQDNFAGFLQKIAVPWFMAKGVIPHDANGNQIYSLAQTSTTSTPSQVTPADIAATNAAAQRSYRVQADTIPGEELPPAGYTFYSDPGDIYNVPDRYEMPAFDENINPAALDAADAAAVDTDTPELSGWFSNIFHKLNDAARPIAQALGPVTGGLSVQANEIGQNMFPKKPKGPIGIGATPPRPSPGLSTAEKLALAAAAAAALYLILNKRKK